jgi:hypothetical protein
MNLAAKIDSLMLPSGGKEAQSKTSIKGEGLASQHEKGKKSLRLSIRKLVKKVF